MSSHAQALRKNAPRRPPAAPASGPPHARHQPTSDGERTVKRLRLSEALTVPEAATVSDACRRMASRRIDAALLTDANGLLSGIVTDKDIAGRLIAEGLRPEHTAVAKVMTRNPVFVGPETLAIEALQKMVHGKFRHLPIVENGEVIAVLDIAKCLYDAISRMEKAAEQGSAIATAIESVEHHWGAKFSAQQAFIETLRDKMFKPTLSTLISENTKLVVVSPSDTVYLATKKMREYRATSAVVYSGGKPRGILTSRDVLTRVVAQNLCPELTLVEKAMTANPECATMDTTILDALHVMHDGQFLHLPVLDPDGCITACLDVLQITHAAISMVEGGTRHLHDVTGMMMQKFWYGLPLEPPDDDCDNDSETSTMTVDVVESEKVPSKVHTNSFTYKFVDQKGRVHRFSCGTDSLTELLSAIQERTGLPIDSDKMQLLYQDDEGDKVLLLTNSDLVCAINHARASGLKVLRLHLEHIDEKPQGPKSCCQSCGTKGWSSLQTGTLAGAFFLTGVGLTVCLARTR